MEPNDLIARIKKGDERLFEQVYKEYHARLFSYVFGYVRDAQSHKRILPSLIKRIKHDFVRATTAIVVVALI